MIDTLMKLGILIVGFILSIKGADFFVDGSSSVAKRLKVPSMIIGLTIVAMGTSLPECAVSVTASMSNNNALAVSNVVGSNLFNLMVVCGVCTLFVPLAVSTDTLKKEFPFSIICAALLLVFGLDSMLGRVDSAIFIVLFAAYLGWMIYSALQARNKALSEDNDEEIKLLPVWQCIVYIIGGAAAIKFGGDFVVEGATAIATMLGLSQNLIGLTIVALGTSLPELVTSIVAARKNEIDMALGNVIGSNIFNMMFVIGVCSILATIGVKRETIIRDIPLSLVCATLLLIFGYLAFGDKSHMILGRFDGIIFLIIFAVYVLMMVFQAMRARNNQEVVQLETMENEELMIMSYPKSLLCIVGGAAAIAFGGDLTVDAASRIAIDFGMSQNLVGLTIVSIGTSLPELVTSIVAARKNEVDMAVGNAIGSNIFNILMVLGIASAISPLQLIGENVIDIIVLVVFSVVVWIFGATKKKISRTEGIAMICMYLCYSAYIIMR